MLLPADLLELGRFRYFEDFLHAWRELDICKRIDTALKLY